MNAGHGAADCTARLLGRFREYAHFAPHACRDMRYEDIVHGGHGAQARRARAVRGPCVQCACRVRALCVHCACTLRLDLGVQARRLLRELGLPAKLDLMAAMRRIGKWHKEHLKPNPNPITLTLTLALTIALNPEQNPNHNPGASQAEGARRAIVRLGRAGRAPCPV